MRSALPVALLAALCAAVAAQDSILDIALASGGEFDDNLEDFDVLVTAIRDAGLVDAVTGLEGVTLFAPNDDAFVKTAQGLGFEGETEAEAYAFLGEAFTTLGGGDPVPVLTNILLYHISPSVLTSTEVLASELIETLLEGATIRHNPGTRVLRDNAPALRNPRLVVDSLDIEASNGVIHVINRVLVPVRVSAPNPDPTDAPTDPPAAMSILDIAVASGDEFDDDSSDFDILVAAVTAADLVDAVAGLEDATLFAPNDAAFISTAQALGFDGDDEEEAYDFIVEALTELGDGDPIPVLSSILLYHISPSVLDSAAVLASEVIDTLLDGVTIRHNPGTLVLRDRAPTLRNPRLVEGSLDIAASNGIIHVIDRVLIPVRVAPAGGNPSSSPEPSSDPSSGPSASPVGTDDDDDDDDDDDADDDDDGDDDDDDTGAVTDEPAPTEAEEDDDVCFPAGAEVTLADGSARQLGSLEVGDVIRTGPASADLHTVFFFSHKNAEAMAKFVQITLASGSSVKLSPSHMLPLADGRLVASRNVVVGDMLTDASGEQSSVTALETVRERGLYAPHTLGKSGTLVVDGVVVSEFTTAVHPTLARALLKPVKAAYLLGLKHFTALPEMAHRVTWSRILGSQGLAGKKLVA